MLFKFIISSILMSAPAIATEIYPWEIKCMTGSLDKAQTANKSESSCSNNVNVKPSCAAITDELCEALWSKKNSGNMKVGDGEIFLGKSKKSELSQQSALDIEALLNSEKNLPADLRTVVAPMFAEYRELMKKETDSNKWYRDRSILQFKIEGAVDDIAEARLEKKYPGITKKRDSKLTIEEKIQKIEVTQNLKSQVLDAKYANHPNWKRVEKVFGEAKKDILKNINEMKLTSAQKKRIYDRLDSVQLSLPYSDPGKLGSDEDCGTTTQNAYYTGSFNKFTVCAGIFNSLQTESGLYKIIAHELSHSIDAGSNASDDEENSALSKDLKKLIGASKAPYSCDKWNQIVTRAKNLNFESKIIPDPLQDVYDCLAPKEDLKKVDPKILQLEADTRAKERMGIFADANTYVLIAQPTNIDNEGKKEENQYYLRPDRLRAKYNDTFQSRPYTDSAQIYEILNQSLACTKGTSNGRKVIYSEAAQSDRAAILESALKETSAIYSAQKVNEYKYCTVNCEDLQKHDMSKPSDENFADWLANKATGDFLSRQKDLRSKREASGIASSFFCNQPGPAADAPDLAATQKKFSMEVHPDNHLRRTSLYNKRNAQIVECDIAEKDQGFGKCEQK